MKRSVWTILFAFSLGGISPAWSGPIFETASKSPSDLLTPLGPQSNTVRKLTSIACYDASNGILADCSYDFSIIGLTQPASAVANNGGHTHDPNTHPLGVLQVIAPTVGSPGSFLTGQTSNDIIAVSHEIPRVSGRIDTVLNLRVPPGWRTVVPESLDETRTSWRFITTVDVGVLGLTSLPDGSPSYAKVRNPDLAHTDAVAFFGTADALIYLQAIADAYSLLRDRPLSINDMSLPRGGLFDWQAKLGLNIYSRPHKYHRTGQSVDINKTEGDCLENLTLRKAVDMVMPTIQGSPFQKRNPPSRFLCEAGNNNNIHIDFDVMAPASPSPF